MSKYLVTGGAGFIGSNLTNYLVEQGHEVIVVDDLSMGKISNLNDSDKIDFIKSSVTDETLMTSLMVNHDFDYIFHLAAIASVADSVERPVETHHVNFDSVLLLLELIRQYQPKLKRLIFSSSAAVYGDEPTLPKAEESVIRPLTPYAIDKFAAEKYVLAYNNLYNVPATAVRFFNIFGPNQNPESPYSGVISILLDRFAKAKAGEEAVFTLFGDGEQTRDFVFIEDVIQALLLVAEKESARGEVFNVGNSNQTSLNDLLALLSELTQTNITIVNEAERQGDIKESYANNDKLSALGFQGNYTVKTGLKKYLDFIEF
ncbi:NAD-dependent epimerase/dehydratase family protein [Vagococcus vulneris]|uniref:Epimerase n=1 Tax=Vagococcus vulneris TaxID=1977869 RepID=A0A429ZZX9_9ENTE|nr:NAD-dependent epimerase/dehydratase family protein [Vagococcus vulneris]RST99563.1 epimerase [Vagococcus vulneris]